MPPRTLTCTPLAQVPLWGLSFRVFVDGVELACSTCDGFYCVILEEGLQEHAQCAEHTNKHKDPQKEAVDHHGDILPVLAHLWSN